jgi:Rieske 2Fe-2S family protein
MNTITNPPVTQDEKTVFFLLDQEYYTSSEIFQREHDRIFLKDWIYAGHMSQIPERGDYFMFRYGGEEIVVVRGDEDAVHANLNVCRHRGYRLCEDEAGHVRSFICGYHQWTFNLDGSLKRVPQMRDGQYFDYCKYGLRTAQVEVWNSLIFVYLGEDEVEPVAKRFAPMDKAIKRFAPERTKLAHAITYDIKANWKVVVDNAMECYHCAGNHESLCAVVDVPGLMADIKHWLADPDGSGPTDLGGGGMRLRKGMKSMSRDGSLISSKLLGDITPEDADNRATGGVMMVPNFSYSAFYVDHWWTIAIRPKSATETELLYAWYIHEDAVEDVDYDLGKLIEVGDNTQVEDNVLIERTQKGMESRFFEPGPIGSDVEPALFDFVKNYRKYMD